MFITPKKKMYRISYHFFSKNNGFIKSFSTLSQVKSYSNSNTMIFPNEKVGSLMSHNWCIASAGIDLNKNTMVYYNPNFKSACHFTKKEFFNKSKKLLTLFSEKSDLFTEEVLTQDIFDDTEKAVCDILSESNGPQKTLFVVDSEIGSRRPTVLKIRIVTDCPVTAITLKNILCPIPIVEPHSFTSDVLIRHSSIKDDDSDGIPYIAVYSNQVVARGNIGLSSWINALTLVSSKALEKNALILKGNVFVDNDEVSFALGKPSNPSTRKVAIYNNFIWSENGISRLFNYSFLPVNIAPVMSVIDSHSNRAIVPKISQCASLLAHPSKIILYDCKTKNSKIDSVEECNDLLQQTSPFPRLTDQQLALFHSLVKKHDVTILKKSSA